MQDSFSSLLDPSKHFQVETDASDYAIGVVLYQDGKPIAFESKKLNPTQYQYTIVQEKELFAVIHALRSWHHYLYGNRFVVTANYVTNKTLRGSMNTMVDALSLIKEVNMLNFIEITSNLYDHLQGKYHDDSYQIYWARVESRTDITTPLKESFHIVNGLLHRNGKVCVPDFPEVKKRILFY